MKSRKIKLNIKLCIVTQAVEESYDQTHSGKKLKADVTNSGNPWLLL
jgi:hypothetical protein